MHKHSHTLSNTHTHTCMHAHTHTHALTHMLSHTPVPVPQALTHTCAHASGYPCPLSCVLHQQHHAHLHSTEKHCRASADSTAPAFWMTVPLIHTQLKLHLGCLGLPAPSFLSLSGPQIQEPQRQLHFTFPLPGLCPPSEGWE